jgi:hypothetical protein
MMAYIRCPNLVGQTFGRLTVIERTSNDKDGEAQWLCVCSCGNENLVVARTYSLRGGKKTSCGCYHKERARQARTKHGESKSRLYKVWADMKQRCQNKNDTGYKRWGGRGIGVCKEWTDPNTGFENFRNWALSNGYKEELTIDRIDNNGNYEPRNCRWATDKEQGNNKRNNHLIEFDGKTQTLQQWADELGVPRDRLAMRLRRGWTIERSLTEQPNGRRR